MFEINRFTPCFFYMQFQIRNDDTQAQMEPKDAPPPLPQPDYERKEITGLCCVFQLLLPL